MTLGYCVRLLVPSCLRAGGARTGTFDNKTSTSLIWSPKGRHMIAATFGSTQKSDLEFWDLELDSAAGVAIVDKQAAKNADPAAAIALITTVDHYGATAADWDPSGRYVGISGTIWQSTVRRLLCLR